MALGPEEWQAARDVRLRSLADAPSAFLSTHAREAAFTEATWRDRARRSRTFVARDGAAVVGTAAGVDGWSGDPTRRELVGMWVAPTHRGRGVARALLAAVTDWARSDGATALALGVLEGNHGARAAYGRMGLRPTGVVEPAGADDPRTVEVLELDLGADS